MEFFSSPLIGGDKFHDLEKYQPIEVWDIRPLTKLKEGKDSNEGIRKVC